MGAWIEVHYNCASGYGKSFSAGSTRMYEAELGQWLSERLEHGPVLITDITAVRGDIGDATRVPG